MGLRSLGQTAWTLILEPVTLGRLPELSVPPLSHLEMDIKKKKQKTPNSEDRGESSPEQQRHIASSR